MHESLKIQLNNLNSIIMQQRIKLKKVDKLGKRPSMVFQKIHTSFLISQIIA